MATIWLYYLLILIKVFDYSYELFSSYHSFLSFSIDRDAQLLANRIALLKQEEMKTWKKIEETKKRTNDIQSLKKRNEDKI